MRLRTILLVIVLMAAWFGAVGYASSAEKATKAPVVSGPEEAEPYKLIRLSVANCDSAVWFIEPAEKVDQETSPDSKSVVWTGPPGEYVVHTVTLSAGKLGQVRSKVKIKGDVKPDPPEPRPDPNPQPGKRDVILIEESADRTTDLAQLIANKAFRDYLNQAGHQWHLADKDVVPASLAPWAQRAGSNLPRFFIADSAGSVLYEGDPPKAADAIALLKKHGG